MTPKKGGAQRKNNAANTIPDEIQRPMRDRLRLIRETLGISRNRVKTLSSGTVIRYERDDLSSLKLGDIFELAKEYGYGLDDFIAYLVGSDTAPVISDSSRNIKRISTYLRLLPEEKQNIACELVRVLVDSEEQQTQPRSSKDIIRNAISTARSSAAH